MAFKDLTLTDKIVAVHADFMRHPTFCILGGVTQIGKVELSDTITTACTDGVNVYYGRDFIKDMTRQQLRYLVGHEQLHKTLHHCSEYKTAAKKHPRVFAQAVDYVVNGILESMDEEKTFIARPTAVPPLINEKYADMGVLEVMRSLLKEQEQEPQNGKGGEGAQGGNPMDEHIQAEASDLTEAELAQAKLAIEDAVRQGEMMQSQLRGANGKGARSLSGYRQRNTDWRTPLRRFMKENTDGDDQSKYSPPNRRLLPLDVLLPSRFTVRTGELLIACDTSGSMDHILPVVFGEIANMAKKLKPKGIRVLWWDTQVAGDQYFTDRDYDNIAKLVKPKGGGGTTVSCVAQYVKEKGIKYKAAIMLTDGHIDAAYETVPGHVLWGVVNNPRFVPLRGKVLHINEEN